VELGPDTLWYHGGPLIEDWSEIRWDRERGSADPNAEGPGMYWTTSLEEARGYGRHLYLAKMLPGFRLMPGHKKRGLSPRELRTIYAMGRPDDQEIFLSNWNVEWPGSPRLLDEVLEHYARQRDVLGTFVTLYHDLFRYDAGAFIRAMIALGYDGHSVLKGKASQREIRHLVVYNPAALLITLIK